MSRRWIVPLLVVGLARSAFAAVGCTLSNPAEDLKYLYPEMTSYREEGIEMPRMKDGERHYRELKERLGSDLDPLYEAFDTPYTLYRVFRGETLIGLVHGVNVPGKGGVIQVFLSMDPETAAIRRLFFQRLESPAAKALRQKAFRAGFEGLTLADFYRHDYYGVVDPGNAKDRVGLIGDPTAGGEGAEDFRAAVRGVRKNLILLDLFVFGMRHEPFYAKAREALAQAANAKETRP